MGGGRLVRPYLDPPVEGGALSHRFIVLELQYALDCKTQMNCTDM